MIKIFLSVRNRLAITKKCIEALERHSAIPHDIYIYDNCTNYRVREHFEFAYNLYKHGLVTQYIFNTQRSTFNAFSKAVASNQFGTNHMQDPKWKSCDFLTILDNDIIVLPGWDITINKAWKDVHKYGLDKQVRIIAQSPGGVKGKQYKDKIADVDARFGKLGGSGFWNVSTSFFRDIGYLDITKLVGHNKRHDQQYWALMERVNKGKPYIIGLNKKLCIHCGNIAGSVCNKLTKHRGQKNQLDSIKFEDAEKKIDEMSFGEFMKTIQNSSKLNNDW